LYSWTEEALNEAAGADLILTYFAKAMAQELAE